MTFRAGAMLLAGGVLATWVACSRTPMASGPPAPSPSPGPSMIHGEALPEGLLDLSELRGEPVPLPASGARAEGLDLLRQGMAAARVGDAAGAAAAFDRSAGAAAPFADWAEVLAARAFAAGGDTAEMRRRLARIGEGVARDWSWRVEVEGALAAGDTASAIREAESAAGALVQPSERSAAWAEAGALRLARGERAGALAAFREAMSGDGRTTQGGLSAARLAHDLVGLAAEDRLLVGRTLLAHGGADRGIPMLEGYLATNESPPEALAELRLEVGRVLFNARRYEPAERFLSGAAASSAEAAFLLARTRYRLGRQDQGIQGFSALSRNHPTSPHAAEALFLMGDLAHDAGRTSLAAEHYRQAVATGAHSAAATDAAVRLAGIALQNGDASTAVADLQLHLSRRPRDAVSAPAIYWLGRALLALGRVEEGRTRFAEVLDLDPFSYYGMLAAARLETSLAALALVEPPQVAPTVAAEIEAVLWRIDLLRELELTQPAELELVMLQQRYASDPVALYRVAEGLAEHGQPIAGALLARRIQQMQGRWDDRLLRIVYQFPYRELVVAEARRNGLDPFAVAGLIRQESFFNPVAVSPAGAVGLMQVMPATGAGLARRAGISGFTPTMLRDPGTNVRLGTLFLADQTSRWGGRSSDAFAAYNAGPNRVARWRTLPEHRDEEIYVERIPIAETRDYVKRVKLNGEIYRRLYGQEVR